jgi:hypothetical protein
VMRALSASALLSMVDGAITALQRELATFIQKIDGAPPGDSRVERMHAVKRSTSRRLQRLITLRVTTLAQPAAGTPVAPDDAVAATPAMVTNGTPSAFGGGTPAGGTPSFGGTTPVGLLTTFGATHAFSSTPVVSRTSTPAALVMPAFGSTSATLSAAVTTPAISAATPPQRRVLTRARLPVERIWSTLLALAVLEELDSCWLTDDEAGVARSVVDAGRGFLEAQSRADRRVRKLLKSGTVHAVAKRALKQWRAIQIGQVAALRDADIINRFTALTHMQRASARIVRSIMTDHGCVAAACFDCRSVCGAASFSTETNKADASRATRAARPAARSRLFWTLCVCFCVRVSVRATACRGRL